MKLTRGRIISGENIGNGVTDFTIRTADSTQVVLCEDVVTMSSKLFKDDRLYDLCKFLQNSTVKDEPRVKLGIAAIQDLIYP